MKSDSILHRAWNFLCALFTLRFLRRENQGHLDSADKRAHTPELNAESLEPRILYSAAPAPAEAPAAEEAPPAEEAPAPAAAPAPEATPDDAESGNAEAEAPATGDTNISPNQTVDLVDGETLQSSLTQESLEAVAAAAKQRWVASGISDAQVEALEGINYTIADLDANQLGKVNGSIVTIDDDAAGSDSWFIDATPNLNEEYLGGVASGDAAGNYDLLSVLLHEQGHVLGVHDLPGNGSDVMNEQLGSSARRLPAAGQAEGATPGAVEGEHFVVTPPGQPLDPSRDPVPTGGSGIFSDSSQSFGNSASLSVSLGDVDGDGDLDAFVANNNQGNTVWLNDGSGTFTDSSQGLGSSDSTAVRLGDVDGDGDLDAFVANDFGDANKVWLNDGSGVFTDSSQSLGSSDSTAVRLGDVDGDGDLDAFVANFGQGNKVWLNDGSGSFSDSSQGLGASNSYGVSLGDVDGDGDLDAFVANSNSQANKVWLNDGSGSFSDSSQSLGSSTSFDVSLGDVDGDGDLDAFVANSNSQANTVWLNDGSGLFSDSSQSLGSSSSRGVNLGDVDGDGDLDAFVANGYNQGNKVWLNDGSGSFSDSSQSLGSSWSEDVSLGDVDGDGDLDAFVANSNSQANTVWLNQNAPTNADPVIAPQAFNAAENQTAVGTVVATDADLPGDTQTFTITGSGADDAKFSITAGGVLSFNSAPNFESPNDLAAPASDNDYEVEVKITDTAGATDTATITVSVTNVNEAPTGVVDTGSAGENETKNFDVANNDTDPDASPTLTAKSIDTVGAAVSLNGDISGIDSTGAFSIDAGEIKFTPGTLFDALDFNDSATVIVGYTVEDEFGATGTSTLTLTINGTNDNPVVGNATVTLVENALNSTPVHDVDSTDIDTGDNTPLYAINSGNADSAFAIDPNTGVVTVNDNTKLDFDTVPQRVLGIIVTDDQGATDTATITVDLTNAPDNAVPVPADPSDLDGANNIQVTTVGGRVIITIDGEEVYNTDVNDITEITINGGLDDDTLTIDAATAASGLTINYNGQGQSGVGIGDSLVFTGGAADTAVYDFTNNTDGAVTLTTGGTTTTINYTGLEPVTSTITAADVTLNFSGVNETITVSDAGGGQTTVDSDVGGETVTFNNPTGTLTINSGAGDDIIDIDGLAANYAADLIINGQADNDTVNFNSDLSFAAGSNVSVDLQAGAGQNINLNANLTTTGGTLTLSNPTVLGGNVTLDTTNAGGVPAGAAINFGSTINLGANTLTHNAGATNTSIASVISGVGGSLTKTGTGTLALSNSNTYTGATTITAGALQVDGSITGAGGTVAVGTAGTLSGTGTVDRNATLTGNGIIDFGVGGIISGTLGVTGGNWNGVGSVTGLVTSSSGTFTIGAGATLTGNGGLTLTGGTFTGDGTATFGGSSTWTGGNMTGAGITNFNGSLDISANSQQLSERTLNSNAAGSIGSGTLNIRDGATFNNTATGTLTVTNAATLNLNGAGATSSFVNAGTLTKNGAGGLNSGLPSLEFDNSGTLNLNAGSMYQVGGTNTGLMNLGAGLFFSAGDYTFDAGTQLLGTGTLDVNIATVTFNGISNANTADFRVTNGQADFSAGANFVTTGGFSMVTDNGQVKGDGTSSFGTGSTWAAGGFQGTGVTNFNGSLDITQPIAVVGNRTVNTFGATTWGTGTLTLNGTASVNNQAAGTFTVDTAGTVTVNGNGTLTNAGTFNKTGVGTLTMSSTLAATNTNAINVQQGTLDVDGTHTGGGTYSISSGATLRGSGSITADISGASGSFIAADGATFTLGDATSASGFSTAGTVTVNGGQAITINDSNAAVLGSSTVVNGTLTKGGGSQGFSLSAGDVLSGSGTVIGAVITNSGTISPGNSPGILATGNLNLAGNYIVEVDGGAGAGAANGHDQIDVTGSVTLNAGTSTLTVDTTDLTAGELNAGDELVIINNDLGDAVSGEFSNFGEGSAVVSNFDGDLDLVVTSTGGDGNDVSLLVGDLQTRIFSSGNDLIIEDIAETTNDQLTISVSGGNLIVTEADTDIMIDAQGVFNGATGDLTNSVTISLATFTGNVILRTGDGDDTILIDNLDLIGTQGLTVEDGGGTDSVTFQTASSDLNNGNVNVTSDTVTVDVAVASGGGNVDLISNTDVDVNAAVSSNGGNITLTADNDGNNDGTADIGATVTAAGGDINISGSQATGRGVSIAQSVTTTGAGTIDITGSSDDNEGVAITNGAVETSGAGNVTITGTGGNAGGDHGVSVIGSTSSVSSAGGAIDITGSSTGARGVHIDSADVTNSSSGNITVTGTGGSGAQNFGVYVAGSDAEVSSASGDIKFTGESAGDDDIRTATDAQIKSTNGDITLTADDITIGGDISSTGTLTIAPRTASTTIGIGGGTGDLNIDDTELGFLQDGFSLITIGDSTGGTGAVDVDDSSFDDNLTIVGGSLSVTEVLVTPPAATATFTARTGAITQGGNAGAYDIKASFLNLNSNGDIGAATAGDALALDATLLRTNSNVNGTANGDQFLSEANVVTVQTIFDAGTGTITLTDSGTFFLSFDDVIGDTTSIAIDNGAALLLNDKQDTLAGITVNEGGALYGKGTLTAPVTATTPTSPLESLVSPGVTNGQDVATLATGNLSLQEDSVYRVDLDGTAGAGVAGGHDQLLVTGTVTIDNAVLSLDKLNSYNSVVPDTFVIIDNDGTADAVTGTFKGLAEGTYVSVPTPGGLLPDEIFQISYLGTSGTDNDVVLIATGVTATTNVSIDGSGNLVVSDILGANTADNLSISLVGTTYVIEDLGGSPLGTLIVGATQTSLTRVEVPQALVSGGLIVNTLAGDDTVTLGDLGTLAANGNLTIDGGAGQDDIIQTGDAVLTGSGAVDYDAETVYLQSGSSLTTDTGDVELDGTGVTGNGVGVRLRGASITSTSGNVALTGEGGDNGVYNRGILLDPASLAATTTISTGGSITLDGTGGTAGAHATGVTLIAATVESTGAGPVTITGNGGTGSLFSEGVAINKGSTIDAGTGNLTVTGIGGSTGNLNRGINANNSDFVSAGGNITLEGTGGGSLIYGVGIELSAVDVTTTGSGTVTLTGNGASGTLGNVGIKLSGATNVASVDGAIVIEGTANGSSLLNHGVQVTTGAKVGASGLGAVTLTGISGAGTTLNYGVDISGTGLAGPTEVSVGDGKLTVSGTSLGTGTMNKGVNIIIGRLTATGGGDVEVSGTGSTSASGVYNSGIHMTGGAINTVGGSITMTGAGGNGSSLNEGIRITGATLRSTGGGTMTLTGTASTSTSGVYNSGVYLLGMTLDSAGAIGVNGTGGRGTVFNHGIYMQNIITPNSTPTTLGAKGSGSFSEDEAGNFFP